MDGYGDFATQNKAQNLKGLSKKFQQGTVMRIKAFSIENNEGLMIQ